MFGERYIMFRGGFRGRFDGLMDGLRPGEALIMDSGRLPIAWSKSRFSIVNGKLILTNQRLVFAAGRFQNPVEGLKGAQKERVELGLGEISGVEKGMLATVKVSAGREYTFKGMGNAKRWVEQIGMAVRGAQAAQTSTPPPPPVAQPAQVAGKSQFCTECGSPLVAGNKFCGSCGKKL